VLSFFALAYLITWGLGALLRGEPTGLLSNGGMFVAGPLVAALLMIALTDGRAGFRDLGSRLIRWRVGARWYAVVLGLPIVIVAAAMALNVTVLGGSPLDWTKAPAPQMLVVYLAIFIFIPLAAPLAEEIGWRGFALPRLLAGRSALTASLILGVVWALWHLPGVLSDPGLRPPAPFFLGVVSLSVIVTWIFLQTKGSVLVAVLFHAWYDWVLLFPVAMLAPVDIERMFWGLVAVQIAIAVAVVLRGGLRQPADQQPELLEGRAAPVPAAV